MSFSLARTDAFVLQAWLDGRLIVILDGWDECDRSCKDEMQRYISTMLLGRVSLVITSRPAAVDGDAFFKEGEAFQRFELAGLDEAEFGHDFYPEYSSSGEKIIDVDGSMVSADEVSRQAAKELVR